MAVASEAPAARALLWLGALALRARRPARRLCGSVRVALVYVAALLGAYLLTQGSMSLRTYWNPELDVLAKVIAVIAIMGAVGDILVLTAILGWGRFAAGERLTRLLCARLALATAHLPIAPVWCLWMIVKSATYGRAWPLELAAWEAGRFAGTLVLAALLYSLLVELHPGEEAVVSWVSTHVPQPTPAPAPVPALAAEEPMPGPAPPPRRPH